MLQQFFYSSALEQMADILKPAAKGEQKQIAELAQRYSFTAVMAFIASAYAPIHCLPTKCLTLCFSLALFGVCSF